MRAVVLAVGSELLQAGRRDTNAEWLIARLLDSGIETAWRAVVDDDPTRIEQLVRAAWKAAPVVLVTGGLGPTEDDRTRGALAAAFDVSLERDEVMTRRIEALFSERGRIAGPRQALQAERPQGASWIDNALGSAPGILFERDGRILAALPGVPAEMQSMFTSQVAPRLPAEGRASVARVTLRIAGRPESYVDDRVRDLYGTPGTDTTILASAGTVELLVTARGGDLSEAEQRVNALARTMRERLGEDVYGAGDETLASVVGALLLSRRASVAIAESCTGGLLGAALTEVPGSSAWFRGGLVCYANELKSSLAGVPDELMRAFGAVSEPVARALAEGARSICGATFGLAITGIAGPSGGTDAKPVGTVHVALADGDRGRAVKLDWPGDRALIRRRAVNVAVDLLRRRILG